MEINNSIKIWTEKPTKKEVEEQIKLFFNLLKKGDLQLAKDIFSSPCDDWEEQIYSLWIDTYVFYLEENDEEVEDDTFEGKLWKEDLNWLKKLKIDKKFYWEDDEESLFVNLIYEKEITDISADFEIVKNEKGYFVERHSIHVA